MVNVVPIGPVSKQIIQRQATKLIKNCKDNFCFAEIPFEEFQHETKADILMKKTKKELVEIIQNQETIIEDLKTIAK